MEGSRRRKASSLPPPPVSPPSDWPLAKRRPRAAIGGGGFAAPPSSVSRATEELGIMASEACERGASEARVALSEDVRVQPDAGRGGLRRADGLLVPAAGAL